MYVLYSTLLHLPPLGFHCVGGCWDRTQDSCDYGIGCQTLRSSHSATSQQRAAKSYHARLHLIHYRLHLIHDSAISHPIYYSVSYPSFLHAEILSFFFPVALFPSIPSHDSTCHSYLELSWVGGFFTLSGNNSRERKKSICPFPIIPPSPSSPLPPPPSPIIPLLPLPPPLPFIPLLPP